MGKIITLKTMADEKVVVTLELTEKEVLWLKGNLDKMHLFSENNLDFETRLVQRGKREATRYFLMPKGLRKDVMPQSGVKCNKISTKTKDIFIFAVNKF